MYNWFFLKRSYESFNSEMANFGHARLPDGFPSEQWRTHAEFRYNRTFCSKGCVFRVHNKSLKCL